MSEIRDHRVSVAVLAPTDWTNSGPVAKGLRAALDAEFPESKRVGKFDVRWRVRGAGWSASGLPMPANAPTVPTKKSPNRAASSG